MKILRQGCTLPLWPVPLTSSLGCPVSKACSDVKAFPLPLPLGVEEGIWLFVGSQRKYDNSESSESVQKWTVNPPRNNI